MKYEVRIKEPRGVWRSWAKADPGPVLAAVLDAGPRDRVWIGEDTDAMPGRLFAWRRVERRGGYDRREGERRS